ncbi:MAG: pilus assembly protein [Clostridia bacterium]|nr:pilus assembly protein [Deltaproteobacteria bacterium]
MGLQTRSRGVGTRQRGQILVEAAIVLPIAIFAVLGALQLMLIQHGRVMTEYAAFCAARAGIVNNGNWNVMRNAALLASLPIYGRTDSLTAFITTWAKTKAAAEITNQIDTGRATLETLGTELFQQNMSGTAQDVSIVEIDVVSPDANAYAASQDWQQQKFAEAVSYDTSSQLVQDSNEIDFDDIDLMLAHPEAGRLAVIVRVLYPLRIPIVGRIIFELWLLHEFFGGVPVNSDLPHWARFSGQLGDDGYDVSDIVNSADLSPITSSSQWGKELSTLRDVANRYGVYLVPLKASYAMQMQSNAYLKNQREPTWFQ